MFDQVDMVELNQNFIDDSKTFIGENFNRVDKQFCSGLQEFIPEVGRYDLIWSQWVLGHLTVEHLVTFFQRCQAGLAPNGIMVVKENVSGSTDTEFDDLDSSFTRSKESYVKAILDSGFTILKEEKQKGFPKGLYSVFMFALQKKWGINTLPCSRKLHIFSYMMFITEIEH